MRGNGFAVTDAKGTATFEELPQGEVELDVTAEGFLPAQTTFAGDAPDLTVRMDRGAGIKAVLVREDGGRAAQHVRVRITNNGSESLRTLEGGGRAECLRPARGDAAEGGDGQRRRDDHAAFRAVTTFTAATRHAVRNVKS